MIRNHMLNLRSYKGLTEVPLQNLDVAPEAGRYSSLPVIERTCFHYETEA